MDLTVAPSKHCYTVLTDSIWVKYAESKRAGSVGCCFLCSPGGWKEQMSVCTVSCQVGPKRAATDTRAQMVWQKMCRKPLSAWVSHREGLPSLPACMDTLNTSQSGGSKAMCCRLGCLVQQHSYSHKHKHTCICRNVQIQANTILNCPQCTLTLFSLKHTHIKAFSETFIASQIFSGSPLSLKWAADNDAKISWHEY